MGYELKNMSNGKTVYISTKHAEEYIPDEILEQLRSDIFD